MQGGTSSSGRSYTRGVSGLYSSHWNSAVSQTTAPSVVPTLRPTSNRLSSVIDTWPWLMSCSRFCRPLAMLSPRVSMAFFCASALKARKLLGAKADAGTGFFIRLHRIGQAHQGTGVEQVGRSGERSHGVAGPALAAKAPVPGFGPALQALHP